MPKEVFNTSRLLLCEGVEDAVFLRALINARQLGAFDVCPVEDAGGTPGKTGFSQALVGCIAVRGFENIRHIALVADSDTWYRQSFTQLCRQVATANYNQDVAGRFGIPSVPHQSATVGALKTTILLIPDSYQRGALETLLWRAISNQVGFAKTVTCTNAACHCAGISFGSNRWAQAKLDKARVHIAVAVSNRKNPSVGLAKLWNQQTTLISLHNGAFNDIANKLQQL